MRVCPGSVVWNSFLIREGTYFVVELLQEEQTSIGGEIAPVEIYPKILVAFQRSFVYNSHQKNLFHRFDVGLVHLHLTMNRVLFYSLFR